MSEAREIRAFLDTSSIFAAVLSPGGGARAVLAQGELGLVSLWVGRRVLREADEVLARKAPDRRGTLAVLLNAARVQTGPVPDQAHLVTAESLIDYKPDAYILAEALAAGADFLITHDAQHFLDNPRVAGLACRVCTPGEFLAWWMRGHLGTVDEETTPGP